MNMKQPIAIVAALALGFSVQAQSLEDGIKMVKYERYESAKKILQPLSASNPTANYYLGLAELGLENTSAAQAAFNKYPEDAANMAGMARVAFAGNNNQEGTRLAQAAADKAKKKDWQPIKFAADAINYSGSNPQQAVDLYKKALERNDNDEVRIGLGDAYQKIQGGGGEAMNNYEKVIGRDPKNSLAFSRIGALWYAAKNYPSALENYAKAKEADPQNPLPYRDLANAYFYVGKYELAKQNIEEYLKLSDKSVDDQIMYANILYLAKYYQDAANKMQELIRQGVEKPYMYRVIGYSQYELKDYPNALQNLRTFFSKQDPKKILPSDYLYYGLAMTQAKQTDSANNYFNMAVQIDTAKDKSETYRKIAEGLKDAKDFPKAAQWYGRIIKEYPASPAIDYFWAGAMSYYAKDFTAAGSAFEQMETKYPDQPSATYWRGRVAAAIDNEAKTGAAIPFYQKWLSGTSEKKNADLMQAYQYLALYYYNKNDKANMQQYIDKIEAIDPQNSFIQQIKNAAKSGAVKQTGAKGGKS